MLLSTPQASSLHATRASTELSLQTRRRSRIVSHPSVVPQVSKVTVVSVSDGDFDQVVADGTSGVCRVTVRVTCQGTEVSQMSWLAVDQP